IEELKAEDSDDGFVTESDNSSDSDPSELALKTRTCESDDDDDLEEALRAFRIEDETVWDRLYALRDIISPSTRAGLGETWDQLCNSTKSTTKFMGNFAWVVTTSMILIGLPMALSIEGESMLVAHEKEMERQTQGQQTILGASGNALKSDQPRTAVTPTGF
ncbi:hypothetical protein CROQUDRAFT_656966, partial [Cronartium quercuum f. sp. fusiforme G11]